MERIIFLLTALFFLGTANAKDDISIGLSFQSPNKDQYFFLHKEQSSLKFEVEYNLTESSIRTKKIIETKMPEEWNYSSNFSSAFEKEKTFFSREKLFLGLSYEYRQDGSQRFSFLTKSRDIDKNYLTIYLTPKGVLANIRFTF